MCSDSRNCERCWDGMDMELQGMKAYAGADDHGDLIHILQMKQWL